MTIQLTEEQTEFQDMLRRFFREAIGGEYLQRRIANEQTSDADLWQKCCELGLHEYFSGEGQSGPVFRELGILAAECGRALMPEMLLESIFYGPYLFGVLLGGNSSQELGKKIETSLLSEILAGDALLSGPIHLTASRNILAWKAGKVSGQLDLIPTLDRAKGLVCCAAKEDGSKALVFLDLAKASSALTPALDISRPYFSISCKALPATLLAEGELINKMQLLEYVLRSLECSGISAKAIELTQEYVKTRTQFGVPVGGFQAVQHRLADSYLQSEALEALSSFASWSADHSEIQFELSARSALLYALEECAPVVETAIQLHGGIGFTWEHVLHLYLRRAKFLEILYGSEQDFEELLLGAAANL